MAFLQTIENLSSRGGQAVGIALGVPGILLMHMRHGVLVGVIAGIDLRILGLARDSAVAAP